MILGSGFGVSDLFLFGVGILVWEFWFEVLVIGFFMWGLGFGFWILAFGLGFRILDLGFRSLGFRTLGFGIRVLGSRGHLGATVGQLRDAVRHFRASRGSLGSLL